MKFRLLSIALPLLAGVTIIGTGFSIFYFIQAGENGNQATAEVSVEAEMYAQLGNLSLDGEYGDGSGFSLIADSTTDGGINLFYSGEAVSKDDVKNRIDLTYDLTLSSTDSQPSVYNKSPKITMTLTVPDIIDNYIAFGLDNTEFPSQTSSGNNIYTYSNILSGFTSGENTIEMSAFTFKYESGKEPTDSDEYDDMVSAFNSADPISINYVLEWVDND